jgi:L,D-peptidoglycan transpeptidase YkuD (ErfK/YbiS/YcfS/YnhG family)
MRKLGSLLVVVVLGLLLMPTAAQAAVHHHRLGGVRVAIAPGTRQVVTVDHTRGYHARIAFWTKRHGQWQRHLLARDGRIGYGGLVAPRKRHQGTGTTPLGTVGLISAFGRHPRADGWDLPYRRIRKGDYWVEDNGSRFYNRYRNKSQGGFRWWLPSSAENSSERLRDFRVPYEYSVVTGYNHSQVRHRGAGIFLHVNGSGATAGCVSAPRAFMRQMMTRLDPDQHPVMAVGR